MFKTLCIDTSGEYCSVAVAHGEQIFDETRHLARAHNEFLLPMMEAVLARAQLSATQLELVGFTNGPGSFTGVRIAAAACQALALVAQCPVVTVRTSQALALSVQTDARWCLTSVASRGDAYYLALYDLLHPDTPPVHDDLLCTAEPDWLQGWDFAAQPLHGAGSLPPWLQQPLASQCQTQIQAQAMLGLLASRHRQGLGTDAAQALPVYMAGDSPWKKRATPGD